MRRAVLGAPIAVPGIEDPRARSNGGLICHGVEGNWFHSSAAWERLVRPIVEAARGD